MSLPILDLGFWILDFRRFLIWPLFVPTLLTCVPHLVSAASLQMEITSTFSCQVLDPASLRYVNSAGETFSITRVSYLLSDFGFQRNDGSWVDLSNSVGWLDLEQNRGSVRLEDSPAGAFRAVRFS